MICCCSDIDQCKQGSVSRGRKKINYLNIFMTLSPRFTKTDSQAHEAVAICAQLYFALPRLSIQNSCHRVEKSAYTRLALIRWAGRPSGHAPLFCNTSGTLRAGTSSLSSGGSAHAQWKPCAYGELPTVQCHNAR